MHSQLPAGILYARSILTQRVAASVFHLCSKLLTIQKFEMRLRGEVSVLKILFISKLKSKPRLEKVCEL